VVAKARVAEAETRILAPSGGIDLRTFEIRLRPNQPIEGLRPGMSVVTP